jgi:hypothetical protein
MQEGKEGEGGREEGREGRKEGRKEATFVAKPKIWLSGPYTKVG